MIKLKRSEVLWIVRGIRLARFLRCRAATEHRLIDELRRLLEPGRAAHRAGNQPARLDPAAGASGEAETRPRRTA